MYDYPTPWPTSRNVNRMQNRLHPTLVHSPSSVIVCPTMKMSRFLSVATCAFVVVVAARLQAAAQERSEEHTSELQSPCNLVCRLLLEKKKKKYSSLTS